MAREQTWYEGNGGFVTQGYWKFVLEYVEDIENMIQSLQPKTEWEVEIIDDKLKLK